MASDLPTVAEVYAGQNVFMTGFSGFIGKLIAEKILWECPNVQNIYVMMRGKKGVDMNDRLKEVLKVPAFNRIRENCPERFQKIIPIEGELSAEDLSLSEEDRLLLLNSNIVIHCAATVRFDQHITEAVNINTRSTHIMVELAKQMPDIKSFVYVSTAYSNCDKLNTFLEEKVYPPVANWREVIEFANTHDMKELQILTKKIIGDFPNTYVFTKNLAEHIIEEAKCHIPVVICRPSVVISSIDEPIPHWVEHYFGPLGLSVAYLTGVLRYRQVIENEMNYIFTDVVVRNIVLAAWKRAIDPPQQEEDEVEVYHACTDDDATITMEDYNFLCMRAGRRVLKPFVKFINITGFPCLFLYWYHHLFGYALPGYIIDAFISLTDNDFRMQPLRIRVTNATRALKYFYINEFHFLNKKFTNLPNYLSNVVERRQFDCSTRFDWFREAVGTTEYFSHYILGEITNNTETYVTRFRIFYWIDMSVLILSYIFFGYITYWITFHTEFLTNLTDFFLSLILCS